MRESSRRSEGRETGRLESFSDGIFAFAITLLTLGLQDPGLSSGSLLMGLVNEWPSFLAFLISFATIMIMWINHHNMFRLVRRIDTFFMFLNGLLLMFVTLTPFTTSLVSHHLTGPASRTAATLYSGCFLLINVSWNALWRRAAAGKRLLRDGVPDTIIRQRNRSLILGFFLYLMGIAISLADGFLGVLTMLVIFVYWAISSVIFFVE